MTKGYTIAARAAAVLVAAVAGAASFEHIASVAIGAGERPWVGFALPLAIDGLIVVGVAALLEDKRTGRRGRLTARLAVLVGVVATLAANVASAEPSTTARLVAVAAPVSFLLCVEVLTRSGRKVEADTPVVTAAEATGAANLAEASGDNRAPVASPRPPRQGSGRRRSARQRVEKLTAKMPSASTAELAGRLKVSEATVRRYRPVAVDATPASEVAAPNGHTPAAAVDTGAPVGGGW